MTRTDAVSYIGSAASVIALALALAALFTQSLTVVLLAASLGLIAIAAVVSAFIAEKRLRVDERARVAARSVVASSPAVSQAAQDLCRATVTGLRAAAPGSAGAYKADLVAACRSMAYAFGELTGDKSCRVTLFTLFAPDDGSRFAAKRQAASYTMDHRDGIDWVHENTDFHAVVTSQEPMWLCNDLPAELSRGYRNSHWTPEKLQLWAANDEYPYRAAAAWPVKELHPVSEDGQPLLPPDFEGILDAQVAGSLDRELLRPVGELFAAGAYSSAVAYRAHQTGGPASERHNDEDATAPTP